MKTQPRILVVDDEPHMLGYMRRVLETESYRVETVSSGQEALRRLDGEFTPDLVLLDTVMPEMSGLETLAKMRQLQPKTKVIMLSCMADPKTIVQAIQLGALDYIAKPFDHGELHAVICRQISDGKSAKAGQPLEVAPEEVDGDTEFVAPSEAMRRIRTQVAILADVDVPILLLGESGTGKGVIAKLVHKLSPRSPQPYLNVNCAALPPDLLESELFGYEPGAFTGAQKAKPGKFEQCDKGTILLDEIGELSPGLQAKLLHVLQDREFSRLGSRSIIRVDVRVIAATNVDVPRALASGRLREDLYYRLNAFTIQVPPLRERREEIPLLMRYFMSRAATEYGREPLALPPALLDAASAYNWPGNVRELENFVKRYLIIRDETQMLRDLGAGRGRGGTADSTLSSSTSRTSDLKSLVRDLKSEAEMDAISRTLDQVKWNRKKAAQILNISYKALLYKIRKYGLEKSGRA